jgi:hypothetical protein
MNYDNWKLQGPPESDSVSSCCGSEVSHEIIDQELVILCKECYERCSEISEEEYRFNEFESEL